ncbi:hypothetical protein Pfo_030121 [Paulownia fortunei]|nr:hypothetical protein Pfo_030121 [Paulownia fortunei]
MERGWKPNVEVSPACPRCGSSNTKFCYYNNYSLTQPRYFCKGCRRYWTKGGSLRNVPIGGGCRKSRRGKSIRVSTDGDANSRNLAHNGIESSSSISAGHDASTSIDLAAVYANFLNQTPRPENHIEALSELPDGITIPSIEFSNFQSLHMNHLSSHLPQESGFFECGPFPARLSETQLLGSGNSMFFGELDAFRKQQLTTGCSFTSINPMDNAILPPLPGEDVAASDGILWPGSDVILSNQILPPTHETPGTIEPAGQNSELMNGNMNPFSALNLEAIFRS